MAGREDLVVSRQMELPDPPPNEPLVDVILPTYNGEDWVAEAVASVLAQTYPRLHLIVADDGSVDHTLHRVRQATQPRDASRVTILRAPGQGAAAARMHAASSRDSPLIAFIDQDDIWELGKLERQVQELLSNPDLSAIHTDVTFIDAHGAPLPSAAGEENRDRSRLSWSDQRQVLRSLVTRNSIRLVTATITRRSFLSIGGFRTDVFGGEDWDFWVRLAAAGHRISHIPEALARRRVHGANTSIARARERRLDHLRLVEELALEDPELMDLARVHASLVTGADIWPRLREEGRRGAINSLAATWRQLPRTRQGRLRLLRLLTGAIERRIRLRVSRIAGRDRS